jgi:integrase
MDSEKEKKKRREKGAGLIKEYEKGKWTARITKDGKVKAFYGKTRAEVTKKLDEYKKKQGMGLIDEKPPRYGDFMLEWLKIKNVKLKPTSYQRIEGIVETHLKPSVLWDCPIDKIDTLMIQEVIDGARCTDNKRNGLPLSYSSLKKIHDTLNASLEYAYNQGRIVRNPARLAEMPPAAEFDKKEIEILTREEISRFVAVASAKTKNGKPVYQNGGIFLFMLNTGLRIGEAVGLKWSDCNEEKREIRLSRNIVRVKGGLKEQSTKTKHGNRSVPLNQNAVDALPKKRRGEYVFASMNGEALSPRNVQRTLDIICEKAGIEKRGTHVFRHTFASLLFENGEDVKYVSELLGHANIQTTYNIYIKLIKEQKIKAVGALKNIY